MCDKLKTFLWELTTFENKLHHSFMKHLPNCHKRGQINIQEVSQIIAYETSFSSYDEYVTEVRSGRLEWSPVHRSEKFWRENADRLNEKNYELLKILIHLLESSQDPLILSVASFDLGEYVRHYPRGKQ